MTINEAAQKLKNTYDNAPRGCIAVSIHLFGIVHAKELAELPIAEVCERAGLKPSYVGTELHKGMKLADYVQVKE